MIKHEDCWQPGQDGVDGFNKICLDLVQSEELFRSFKTNPIFTKYVGTNIRGENFGLRLLQEIKSKSLIKTISRYASCNIWGGLQFTTTQPLVTAQLEQFII
jgi:hypothetical protein